MTDSDSGRSRRSVLLLLAAGAGGAALISQLAADREADRRSTGNPWSIGLAPTGGFGRGSYGQGQYGA